jgi:REP element-mobilizing transposase RayT
MKNTLHFFSELLEQQDVMKTTPAQVDSSKNTLIMKEEDAKKKEANAARD